jgi:hypothetical protein
MLTGGRIDRVLGLELGAMITTKPFSPRELCCGSKRFSNATGARVDAVCDLLMMCPNIWRREGAGADRHGIQTLTILRSARAACTRDALLRT